VAAPIHAMTGSLVGASFPEFERLESARDALAAQVAELSSQPTAEQQPTALESVAVQVDRGQRGDSAARLASASPCQGPNLVVPSPGRVFAAQDCAKGDCPAAADDSGFPGALTLEPTSPRLSSANGDCPLALNDETNGALSIPSTAVQSMPSWRLTLWPVWEETLDDRGLSQHRSVSSRYSVVHRPSAKVRKEDPDSDFSANGCVRFLMMKPSCTRRMVWDSLCFFAMGWDVLLLPMQAFEMPETDAMRVIDWMWTTFWSLDLVFSFFVGHHTAGRLEMRMRKVAKRYLRTWFVMDVIIVTIDWVVNLQILEGSVNLFGIARLGKAFRVARVLRMFKLLRMLKVMSLAAEFSEMLRSETLLTIFDIVKVTILIAMVNHCIACVWYAIGTSGICIMDWVKVFEEAAGLDPDLAYRYSTSLHWSLTQFTPASMEVYPRNSVERFFAVGVILFALVSFSSFISSMTAAMTHLRKINEESARQQEYLRRYLADNRVPFDLGNRLIAALKQRNRTQKFRVHEIDIKGFSDLPESLVLDLHTSIYLPLLLRHPFFYLHHLVDEHGISLVCHKAVSQKSLMIGQELFSPGGEAASMVFITHGQLSYQILHDSEDESTTRVGADDWLCEMALWLQWRHRGCLTAHVNCEMALLDSCGFREVVVQTAVLSNCQNYARGYVEHLLNESRECGGTEYLSDIWHAGDGLFELSKNSFPEDAMDEAPRQRFIKMRTASHLRLQKAAVSGWQSGASRMLDPLRWLRLRRCR